MMMGVFPFLRKPNKQIRSREHLYEHEIEDVIKAARKTRYALRNETMILIGFRRGMRPTETIRLLWDDVCFKNNTVRIVRLKNGISGDHVIYGNEVRLLKRLHKEKLAKGCLSPYVFVTPHGMPLTISAYEKLCEKLGKMAGLPFKFHPHMLRHSWGEKARKAEIHPYSMKAHFGHRSITSTMKYLVQTGNSELNLFAN
jgi:integrase